MSEEQKEFKSQTPDKDFKVHDRRLTAAEVVEDDSEHLPAVYTHNEIIMQAVRNKEGPETLAMLKEMFQLDIDNQREQARRKYFKAMAEWKANAPEIVKDRSVGFDTNKGKTSYKHASLFNVSQKINSSMAPYGLHVSWKTEQADNVITVTCKITHSMGHCESTSLSAAPDNTGNKNNIQAVGSTVTYLERYTVLALTGLATKDQDDDGRGFEPPENINKDQLAEIKNLLKKAGSEESMFCSYMGVETLKEINKRDYDKAVLACKLAIEKKSRVPQKEQREPGMEG
ncbi:MAG: ERF family protein [Candidatus Bathyarchaeota archaeon]|jgi:hypothetical protein